MDIDNILARSKELTERMNVLVKTCMFCPTELHEEYNLDGDLLGRYCPNKNCNRYGFMLAGVATRQMKRGDLEKERGEG
jgi:hypothetical protein